MEPSASAIRTEGLVKVYGQRSVVNGVNIHVQAGEVAVAARQRGHRLQAAAVVQFHRQRRGVRQLHQSRHREAVAGVDAHDGAVRLQAALEIALQLRGQ